MAALQKFKLLATQCGVAESPTRSPRTSPVIILRRRKTTLRMLLSRRSFRKEQPLSPPLPEKKKRESLKELFVSSSSPPPSSVVEEECRKSKCEVLRMRVNGLAGEPVGSTRPGWIGFRHRSMIRRAWRPRLGSIPETDRLVVIN